MPTKKNRVSCHVIAGALGVGKTSTIISCLEILGDVSSTLVIVNDFGQTGLDAEIFRDTSGELEVSNIKGGCLCCSSMQEMSDVIQAALQNSKIKRIIIEPSGLAVLPDLIPYLQKLSEKYPIDLRPVITLINPKRTQERHYQGVPFMTSLVDYADVLVGNRMDQASAEEQAHFREWTGRLQPSKMQVVETSFGRLTKEVFDLTRLDSNEVKTVDVPHHHHEASGGFADENIAPMSEDKFRERLEQWSREGVGDAEVLRFKALLPTDRGWRLFEIAEGDCQVRAMSDAKTSKLDWISRGEVLEDTIRAALMECCA
ncbi:MAG: GTP-binding protein [Verrucomicrobiota bacterium]